MAKGNDFKKPVNNQDMIIDEDEKNKKLIIIVCLSIIVVLGLIIASITYFNNRQVEEDKKNNKDNKKPTEIIKKPEVQTPVEEKPVVTNPTYNYVKPSNPIAVVPPVEEPEEEVQPVSSDTDDYTVTVDENNVVKLTGFSRYVSKVDPSLGTGYNNFVRIKVTLDRKYKLEDLDKLNIKTKVTTGYKNYGVEVIASTEEEIEAGNLYFYWTQAIGDGMPEFPTLDIDYGDGNSVTYVLDISELIIETPVADDVKADLIAIPTGNEVLGGKDRTYEILVLEPKPGDEVKFKSETSTADLSDEVTNNDGVNPSVDNDGSGTDGSTNPDDGTSEGDPSVPGTGSTEPKAPEDKDYILKFTGEANYYDKDVVADLDAELENYHYVLTVRILAPSDITDDEIKNFSLTVTKQNGTKQDLSGANGVIKTDVSSGRKYIYLYYAIDEDLNARPEFIVDWDGEGAKYGKVTYTFDFSELEKAPEKEPETGNPDTPGTTPDGNQGTAPTQPGNGGETPEGGTSNPPAPETPSATGNSTGVSTQTNMVNPDVLI